MSKIIKKVGERERRMAVKRVRRLAELLKQDDAREAVEFGDGRKHDFLDKAGCAKIDPLHRRNLSVCLQCGEFDRLSFVCRVSGA
ncbi:MAG: hypothetical protein ACETWO_00405 [Candidatus Hadarchaeaceae archaeon]